MSHSSRSATNPVYEFQKMQLALTEHIRTAGSIPYESGGLEIEERRLKVYQNLFYNNLNDFLSGIFPVCRRVLTVAVWNRLIASFLKNHQSKTPLFHEVGKEFLDFLETTGEIEVELKTVMPDFLFELAHYEWMELAVSVDPVEGFEKKNEALNFDESLVYILSPLAKPLAYYTPVAEISPEFIALHSYWRHSYYWSAGPGYFYLIFRNPKDQLEFHRLSPFLYQLLKKMEGNHQPLKQHLAELLNGLDYKEFTDLFGKKALFSDNEKEKVGQLVEFVRPIIEELQQKAIITSFPESDLN